jgi:3-oxoadipate enol-lactonase
MTTQTLQSNFHTTSSGSKLHYLQTGCSSGPLLLCLHGLGGSTETFIRLLPHLPSCYNIVLLDFPGFGKSPFVPKSNTVTIAGYVADLGEFIADLQELARPSQARDVIIIGHSLGAIIALQYAAQYPETIGGLALLGSGRAAGHILAARQRMYDLAEAVRTKGLDFAANVATKSNFYEATYVSPKVDRICADRDCRPRRVADPKAKDAVRSAVLASDPEGYAATCEAIVDLGHRDPQYERVTAPAVFVAGDLDMISPVGRSQELSLLLGGTSWVEIVRSGHQPILEDLAGVRQAIDKLVASVAVCSAARAMKDP